MKIHLHKIAVLLVLVFSTATLMAQDKKHQTANAPQYKKDVRATEHRTDSTTKNVRAKNYRSDSNTKNVRIKEYRADSLTKTIRVKNYRTDSTTKNIRAKEYRADSVRKEKRITVARHKRDASDTRKQDIRSKKITMSIECEPNATVFLQNIMHKVNVLTTNSNKAMLVTTVHYRGQSQLTDIEWFSKLKLNMTGNEKNIEIISGDYAKDIGGGNIQLQGENWIDTIYNGVIVFDSLGNTVGAKSNLNRDIVLYVPAGVKVDIESKYADITFGNDMKKIKARIINGGLTLMNAEQLQATSAYATINAGNIKHTEVNITNGKFTAKTVGTLAITSKNSSIVLDRIDLLDIRNSQADLFTIKEAGAINGKKAYGDLLLTSLRGSVNISGVNADVKIKTIKPSASSIKIDTQYAELVLPVNHLKNYTVNFQGDAGNINTPFEKKYATNTSFKASVGNSNSRFTVFQLTCKKCSVDF